MSQSIAAECMYSLKRGRGEDSKVIEGPSARMAEIVASALGNCRAALGSSAGMIVSLRRRRVHRPTTKRRDHLRGSPPDYRLEGRKIFRRYGRRYRERRLFDRARNAVFKGVPKAFWQEIYRVAGDGNRRRETLGSRCQIYARGVRENGSRGRQGFALPRSERRRGYFALDHFGRYGRDLPNRSGTANKPSRRRLPSRRTPERCRPSARSSAGTKEPAGGSTTEPAEGFEQRCSRNPTGGRRLRPMRGRGLARYDRPQDRAANSTASKRSLRTRNPLGRSKRFTSSTRSASVARPLSS